MGEESIGWQESAQDLGDDNVPRRVTGGTRPKR
jgi:hypothetical protein